MKSCQVFNRDYLPYGNWRECRRKKPALATKIEGEFCVIDADGHCTHINDGYLVVDDLGYPVGMTCDEFESVYGQNLLENKPPNSPPEDSPV